MARQYLDVPYRSKDAAKALGARFDGDIKRWYVDDGIELAAFEAWLPAELVLTPASSTSVTGTASSRSDVASVRRGVPLSRLLSSVTAAVAEAFANGVWTLVEVNEANLRGGHVYLELSERDGTGQPVAKARGMIWASTAARILPEFEKATGAVIGSGIKLLVRARPVFKAQYGFSLEIDAIDPEYTLGDLEAKKREIRTRLQQEGLFHRNQKLTAPSDFQLVLVISPPEAAGLGDFQKEADRLGRHGICRFVYAHSRFQGEGAAREIVAAALSALREMSSTGQPDAIVFIRGGGAVNDLAWLNDYELVRFICEQPIPVLTGIGHEKDSTLPDEVANTRFDTPSKVIAGIEQQIVRRSREAQRAWESIVARARQDCRNASSEVERSDVQVRADARAHVARARHDSTAALNEIAIGAVRQVHEGSNQVAAMLNEVRAGATRDMAMARQGVPALMTSIRVAALSTLAEGRAVTSIEFNTVVDRTAALTRSAGLAAQTHMQRVAERAVSAVQQARSSAQALVREVTGQGPEKTLGRGFTIVRAEDGKPVTSRQVALESSRLSIQFRDGLADVIPDPAQRRSTP